MVTPVSSAQQIVPVLPRDVWTAWMDKFREWVEPTTDAALEGIFLVASMELALVVGRHVGIDYGRLTYPNLYGALIGSTGVPRKTTVLSRGHQVRKKAFTSDFVRVTRSIGSGEGLLELFCDEEKDAKTGKVTLKPRPNQRVLLDEPELCNLLKKARRPGTANITETLLSLFDGDDLSPRTRVKPICVQEPFFCLITTTTPENLEMSLSDVDIESGLIPRFAAFYCTPKEPIAYPDPPDEATLKDLATELQDIHQYATDIGARGAAIRLSSQAKKEWEITFKDITETTRQERGPVAAIMARVPTVIMKWALIYMVQAGRGEVSVEHLARATLVGTYLMETAHLVPQLIQKTRAARVEAKIVQTLHKLSGRYLSANQIHRLVSGRLKAEELRRSLDSLTALGVLEEGKTARGLRVYRVV